jgi:hypothetical protein
MMRSIAALMLVVLFADSCLAAAEPAPPVDRRFAAATDETPSFRHVLPLLGRLGCNGRACHGSFQGQGAFDCRCSVTTSSPCPITPDRTAASFYHSTGRPVTIVREGSLIPGLFA